MGFDTLIAVAATFAGAIASVAGFGIGSILTPLFAIHFGTKLAVAAVSIPHLIATALLKESRLPSKCGGLSLTGKERQV